MTAHGTGTVLWFTGLSGAGKTTTAEHVLARLHAEGRRAELLDGDELRQTICKGLGFTREERMENIRRIVYVAGLLSKHGVDVLVSAITPYEEMRAYARQKLPRYMEIYVECPLEECERRDVKGLYAKARSGVVQHFTGISDPYETPLRPDITICTASATLADNTDVILTRLGARPTAPC